MGDIDADGYDDLAVSAYTEDPGPSCVPTPGCEPLWGAGAVTILRGSIDGLTAAGSQFWHQDVPGVPGSANQDGAFGLALGLGDFNHDGAADLAAFAGGGGGSVIVLDGGPHGLTVDGVRRWSQASPGVPGSDEQGDGFGGSLAVADLGRSAIADLVIGVPGEDRGRGRVVILYGTAAGLSADHAISLSQDSPGSPSRPTLGTSSGPGSRQMRARITHAGARLRVPGRRIESPEAMPPGLLDRPWW